VAASDRSATFGRVTDPFIVAAGPAPARAEEGRWRQVALLAASAAISDDPRAAAGLAAALHALDLPEQAARVAERAGHGDPWARWWATLAAGQAADPAPLADAIARAKAVPAGGPDGREVARRLEDLGAEVAELTGGAANGARFALLGHRARPDRRVLIGGRSSAAFLVDPEWDALRLVRLAPSEGPSAGNRAQLALDEVIAAVRRGEAGAGRTVPGDAPAELDPHAMLDALREDPAARDRRLLQLADEVREERAQLMAERVAVAEERAALRAEAEQRRRSRPAAPPPPPRGNGIPPAKVAIPRTASEAAALLEVPLDAPPAEVDRAYRELITRCHPDRVAGLHPSIRGHAEGLTVAVNAARELLTRDGRGPARAVRRPAGARGRA
jgi:DnaJ-domain-containing protein 1